MTCSIVSFGRFSIVSTLFPESVLSSVTHERASCPSISTLHAPQCPVEQPSLLPFMHSTLRRYFRRVMRPPHFAVIALPFKTNVTFSIWLPFPSLFSGIKNTVELLILQHAVHALVEAGLGYRAVFHCRHNGVKRLGQHLGHENDIHARLDRGDRGVAG